MQLERIGGAGTVLGLVALPPETYSYMMGQSHTEQ